MSTMSNDAIQASLEAINTAATRVTIGETVVDASTSQPLYSDSDGTLRSGALPFTLEVTAVDDTTFPVFDFTGRSSLSADQLLSGTLVQGAQVTTFTVTAYAQVNLTDNGGNITDGVQYIQIGTIT